MPITMYGQRFVDTGLLREYRDVKPRENQYEMLKQALAKNDVETILNLARELPSLHIKFNHSSNTVHISRKGVALYSFQLSEEIPPELLKRLKYRFYL